MPIQLPRINWRLLLLHFLSIPLFILGAQLLALVPHVGMLELYTKKGESAFANSPRGLQLEELNGLVADPLYAWLLAVLAGCTLSALVVWHRRESKLLPVVLLLVAIVTSRTHYYEAAVVNSGLALLTRPFEAWPSATRLGIVGSGLLVLGCLPFVLTWRRPVPERN